MATIDSPPPPGLTRALTRRVPGSFARALAAAPPAEPIDVARAQAQHAAYVEALAALGLEVTVLAADEACPDCCFVEDVCVVAGEVAIATRPGAPSRRAEVAPVAAEIARHRTVVHLSAPATLEGGDCLRLGRTFYVGASQRTNPAGIAGLREAVTALGYEVVAVPLPPRVLHLKSVCSPLGDDLVLVADGALPDGTFGGARTLAVPASERHGANVVFANAAALVAADAPRTRERIERAGVRAVAVDTSELRKADGALTCLSILL